jgi:hypothetical protein
MKNILKLTNKKIIFLFILFCFFVLATFDPSYSTDSLRYVFAGKQFFEIFFSSVPDPILSSTLIDIENQNFHSNMVYNFPKREFFTIIPNILFYLFSITSSNGLNYLVILNLFLFCFLFLRFNNYYNSNNQLKYFLFISFAFFGHYQIAGWNIKILPEIIFLFCLLNLIFILIQSEKKTKLDIVLILFLSVSCFFIKPQGIIFLIATPIILIFKKNLLINLSKIILILFILYCLVLPGILYLDTNNILDVPIISIRNTALYDGAIISGWVNYINGEITFFESRFDNKKMLLNYGPGYEQKLEYFDILKITFYRLFYFIVPFRHYDTIILNLWNCLYFFTFYLTGTIYFIKSDNFYKKNIFLFLLVGILSFHMLVPVTGTFRYQLALIGLFFIISFECLKKND